MTRPSSSVARLGTCTACTPGSSSIPCARGKWTRAIVADWPCEDDMHNSQRHLLTAAVAAMIALLATPVPAQTTSEPSATRTSVLDAARDELTDQSAPPTRSKVERALYWYDNQYVLEKVFAGW